jgi:hypothetical protein
MERNGGHMEGGAEMTDYEIRVDYADETFEVVVVPATSFVEALEIAKRDPEVVEAKVLAWIDPKPQVFLAW